MNIMAPTACLIRLLFLAAMLCKTCSVSNSGSKETVQVSEQGERLNINEDTSRLDDHTESNNLQKSFSGSMSNVSQMPQAVSDFVDARSSDVFEAILLFENILAMEKSKLLTSLPKEEHEYTSKRILDGTFRAGKNCSEDISFVFAAARMRIQWALEMIDANGKPGYGTLRHTAHSVGDFDQCMDVKTGHDFEGRYCTTNIMIMKINQTSLSPPLRIALGLCLPSSCGGTDVERVINEYFHSRDDVTAMAVQTNCQERHLELSTDANKALYLCYIFATVLVVATVYDVFYKRWWLGIKTDQKASRATPLKKKINSEHKPLADNTKLYSQNGAATHDESNKAGVLDQFLMSFSVYTNTANLFSTQDIEGDIGCIHGLRFFSQVWIILVHEIPMRILSFGNFRTYLYDAYKRVMFMTVLKGDAGVDTFFAIAGMLMTYSVLRQLSSKAVTPKFFASFYLRRIWRVWPTCMLILVTYVPLTKYIGDGPFWPQCGFERDECKKSWWYTVLFLTNFVEPIDWCMGWTWYLNCDMQYYIISPLMFLPLVYYGWKGLFSPFVFLLANAICSGVISIANDLPSVKDLDMFLTGNKDNYLSVYYIKPYTRIGPYIIGVITGFFLFKSEMKTRLPRSVVILGWTLAVTILLAVVFGNFGYVQPGHLPSSDARVLFNALHRIAWGMGVCWIIFACANGHGGLVNTLLSWKAFVPLSRLTFIAYLINPMIIQFFAYTRRNLTYLDNIHLVSDLIAMTVLVYMAAYVVYIAYEVPMVGLGTIIKGPTKKKKE